jgi:hypothetical protein
MNWKQNLKNWKVLSWKNSFFSLQLLLLQHQCRSQQALNETVLLQGLQLRMMNWLHYRLRWHFKQVLLPVLLLNFLVIRFICFIYASLKLSVVGSIVQVIL